MDTSFFKLIISGGLALVICISIYYSITTYHIRQDLRTLKVISGNKIVTDRLRQYQVSVEKYDQEIELIKNQLRFTTVKKDKKRFEKTFSRLNLEVKTIKNGQRLYLKLINDYWSEVNKNSTEKNPELHKYDLENYIRHSGMRFLNKSKEESINGKQK